MKKRLLSLVLVFSFIFGTLPANVLAGATQTGINKPKSETRITNGKAYVKYKYLDETKNDLTTLSPSVKIVKENYPATAEGKDGAVISNDHLDTTKAPKFIGYEIKTVKTNPVPSSSEKATYTTNGKYTVEFIYKKIDDIKGPQEHADVFPDGYVAVMFTADDSGNDRGEFAGNKREVVYAVNPDNTKIDMGAKKLKGTKADGSEQNVPFPIYTVKQDSQDTWKINNKAPWKMNPDNAIGSDNKIASDKLGKEQKLTFTAQYVKEKGTVTYEFVSGTDRKTLPTEGMPTKPDDKEYDVQTEVTADPTTFAPVPVKGTRESKEVVVGNWTFKKWKVGDKETNKLSVTKSGPNKFTGVWEFTEAGKHGVTYEFKDMQGKTLPIVSGELNKFPVKPTDGKTYYIEQNITLPTTPAVNTKVKGTNGDKQGTWKFAGWYNGNTKLTGTTVKAAGENKFVGKWTFTEDEKKDVEFSFKFYNSKKLTEEIQTSVLKSKFEPTVPAKQTGKYVGSDIDLPTYQEQTVSTGDLQGTWKFESWYRGDTKLTEAKAKVSANDEENKLVGKWILTETQTARVSHAFKIDPSIVGDDKVVKSNHKLPKGVKDQKRQDTTNYIGSTVNPISQPPFRDVEETIDGKVGTWTFVKWDKDQLTVNKEEDKNVFTGTWTWTEKDKQTQTPVVPAPKVEANDDGSVKVTPPTDKDVAGVLITYTDEKDNEHKLEVTKDAKGQWKLLKVTDPSIKIDPKTGLVTIPANQVKDGSEVKAQAEKNSTLSDEVRVKAKNNPKKVVTKWVQETAGGKFIELKKPAEGNKSDNDGVSDIPGYELVRTDRTEDKTTITYTNVYRIVLGSKSVGLDRQELKPATIGYNKENPEIFKGYTFLFDEAGNTPSVVEGKKVYVVSRIYAKNPAVVEVANPKSLTADEQKAVKAAVKTANQDLSDNQISVNDKGEVTITRGGRTAKLAPTLTVVKKGQTDAEKNPAQKPDKTEVKDKKALTKEEKAEVEKKVKEKNPKAAKVEVGNDGSVSLTYPDKSTNTLTPDQTITQKQKPTPGGNTPGGTTPTKPTKPSTPDRVNGKNRVDTAIEISKKYFGQAERVIIVDASNFPDAMAASALAKQLKAPILLTNSNNLDSRVAAEIKRLGAHNVTVIGGKSSVSDGALNQLSKFDKDGVERISGKDRYETSAQVARRLAKITGKTDHAVIASGEVFADALAVGPYAAREGYPILLVKSNSIPKSISDAITEIGVKKVSIVGGYGSVSKSLEKSLPVVAERLSGKTRYETAIEIASKGLKTSNKAFVANGEHWMDALVIGPVGGMLNMPILLTQANSAPKSLRDHIAKSKIDKITAIGGTSMVSDRVLNELSK
ncbi:cell wall-binding repeat-containing protein [Peptostreptococcus anaerobius]|uniref:Putative cell wall binding repeat 2 n=1 Tax=Peptostreptococcus anaerobius 653-L TaxID=596329 RepID=D3MTX4_9FIRM|nr:cell wall-binding repeat-containing protein [Peptostreptococcus anaerobius]EFD04351.1 putative cell wall binding repeat 2 [Peptostreptococcus anaerobius 653-L]